MKLSFKQLNQAYASLGKIAQADFSKEHHKIKYKFSRIWKSATTEIEELQESLRDLMRKCEITPGQQISEIDPKLWAEYQDRERNFLKTTWVDLWGDPFDMASWQIIEEIAKLTPMDLANLDWLCAEEA